MLLCWYPGLTVAGSRAPQAPVSGTRGIASQPPPFIGSPMYTNSPQAPITRISPPPHTCAHPVHVTAHGFGVAVKLARIPALLQQARRVHVYGPSRGVQVRAAPRPGTRGPAGGSPSPPRGGRRGPEQAVGDVGYPSHGGQVGERGHRQLHRDGHVLQLHGHDDDDADGYEDLG